MPEMLWFDSPNGKHECILGAKIPGHKLNYWVMTPKISSPNHEYIYHDSSNEYWEQLCHTESRNCCGFTLQMAEMRIIFGQIPGHKLYYWVMTPKVSGPSHEYIYHDSSNAYWEQLCHTECQKCCGLTLQMANMMVFLVKFQGTN